MKLRTSLWNFGLLILVVAVIQFLLLKIILQFGFTSDDWWLLFDYKTIGQGTNFLEKYFNTLKVEGLYHTYQVIYVGILESFFKGNYQAYQISAVVFKILATISLYPLILVVFKRKLLAFITSLLYGISYSSSAGLMFVCTGGEYLAIFFMNIFLFSYYFYFKTKRKLLLYLATFLLFVSFMLAPIRMYPLLVLIILIELFIWIKSRKLSVFMGMLMRLMFLFLPFMLILLVLPGSTGGHLKDPSTVFYFLSYGNYQLLLPPFAGIGYTFLTNDYWGIFGQVTFDSFKDYLIFLMKGPLIIYTILTILIGFLITKKPLFFILGIIFINLIFEIISYFFVTNLKGVIGPDIKGFHQSSIYAVFFGFFVITVGFSSLIVWLKKQRSNILLLSLFIGPIFSSIFLWGIWMIKGDVLTFKEGIHWYMVVESLGSSLFLASLMVIIFDKIKTVSGRNLRRTLFGLLFITLVPIYLISRKEINTTFTDLLQRGASASDQEQMRNELLNYVKDPLDKNPTLFYFDTQDQPIFYPIPLLFGFEETMHFRDWEVVDGCVGLISNKDSLEKSVVIKDGIRGFSVSSLCVENSFKAGRSEVFYKPENFYAFKLENKDVIDIKQDVLNELGFKF